MQDNEGVLERGDSDFSWSMPVRHPDKPPTYIFDEAFVAQVLSMLKPGEMLSNEVRVLSLKRANPDERRHIALIHAGDCLSETKLAITSDQVTRYIDEVYAVIVAEALMPLPKLEDYQVVDHGSSIGEGKEKTLTSVEQKKVEFAHQIGELLKNMTQPISLLAMEELISKEHARSLGDMQVYVGVALNNKKDD